MTFSDSRVVDFINEHFIPVWESVSPVRVVTFELGEGRSVKGTVSGEIALYFCSPEGLVFDILPALQSPAATLEAMKKAASFHRVSNKHPKTNIKVFQRSHMKRIAGEHFSEAIKDINNLPLLPKKEEDRLQKSKEGLSFREEHIAEAIDKASTDLREMSMSKTTMFLPSGSPLIVVEPGGRDYYRWEVAKRFLNPGSWHQSKKTIFPTPLDPPQTERTPAQWQEELFVHILRQPLDRGQQVTYDSDSLKAIRIIQE